MLHVRICYPHFILHHAPNRKLWVQAPLPAYLHTLPKLFTIQGRGGAWAGPPPSASREEPAND